MRRKGKPGSGACPRSYRTKVQPVTLVLHELATVALNYATLAWSDGRLVITWFPTTLERRLVPHRMKIGVAQWQRLGSRPVMLRPQVPEQTLSCQLRTKAGLMLGPDRVWCHIALPLPGRRSQDEASL